MSNEYVATKLAQRSVSWSPQGSKELGLFRVTISTTVLTDLQSRFSNEKPIKACLSNNPRFSLCPNMLCQIYIQIFESISSYAKNKRTLSRMGSSNWHAPRTRNGRSYHVAVRGSVITLEPIERLHNRKTNRSIQTNIKSKKTHGSYFIGSKGKKISSANDANT